MAVQRMSDAMMTDKPLPSELALARAALMEVGTFPAVVADESTPLGHQVGAFEGVRTPHGAAMTLLHDDIEGAPDVQLTRHTFVVLPVAPNKKTKKTVQYFGVWWRGRLLLATPIRFRMWPYLASGSDDAPSRLVRFLIAAVATLVPDGCGI